MSNETQASAPSGAAKQRRRWLTIAIGAFAVMALAYGTYWAIALRHVQSTDDAYVNGNVVQITPQISGTVVAIGADDTQFYEAVNRIVDQQAYMLAANDIFFASALLALLLIADVWLARPAKAGGSSAASAGAH